LAKVRERTKLSQARHFQALGLLHDADGGPQALELYNLGSSDWLPDAIPQGKDALSFAAGSPGETSMSRNSIATCRSRAPFFNTPTQYLVSVDGAQKWYGQ